MVLKSNANFKKQNSTKTTKEAPAPGSKNKLYYIHYGSSLTASLELRGRSELINQVRARAFHAKRVEGLQNNNAKGDSYGKGNSVGNSDSRGLRTPTDAAEKFKTPRLKSVLGILYGQGIDDHSKSTRSNAKLYRERRKQEILEKELLGGRVTVRKLKLALENQGLKNQAHKFSYKLRLAELTASKRPASLSEAQQLMSASRAYTARTRDMAHFAPSMKYRILPALRFSRDNKSIFQRKGRRHVFRTLSRYNHLPMHKRPTFTLPRHNDNYGLDLQRRPYAGNRGWDSYLSKGWFGYMRRIRRRPWANTTFSRVPVNTTGHEKSWSYMSNLSSQTSRNAYVKAVRKALRVLKEQTPYFMPANKVLYRRWYANRTKRGAPLPRYTFAQENLDWWEEYVNRPREKRGLDPRAPLDPTYRMLEVKGGFPAITGYRRRRRVVLPRFNASRWWRPALLPHPAHQAMLPTARELTQSALRLFKKMAAEAATGRDPKGSKHVSKLQSYSMSDKGDFTAAVHRINYLARQEKALRASVAKHLAHQGANFQGLEVTPLFSSQKHLCSQRAAGRVSRRIISAHPMWGEFIHRRTRARHGVGGSIERAHTFVSKLQNLLLAEIERMQVPAGRFEKGAEVHPCISAMQDVLKHYGDKDRLSWQHAFKKYLALLQGSTEYNVRLSGSLSSALTRLSVSALTEKNRSILEDSMAANPTTANLADGGRITEKPFSKSYQFWLRSAQRSMKKSATAVSSPNYGEDHDGEFVDLGVMRLRFPAAGRRKASYDRSVRNFYIRAAYPQYRRTQQLRFTRIRPVAKRTRLSFIPSHESSSLLRFKQHINHNTQASRYYNRQWRALLNRRSAQIQTKWSRAMLPARAEEGYGQAVLTKRRMGNSAMRVAFNDARAELRAKTAHSPATLTATGEALFARALRERRKSKSFMKLRVKLYRRRLPAEQVFPAWFYTRWERKRHKKRMNPRKSRYNVSPERTAAAAPFWRADVFDLSINRCRPEHNVLVTTTGESLTWLDRTYRREREFSQGPALTQVRAPRRFQNETAERVTEAAAVRLGLNELEQRYREAEKRKKIREEQGLVRPFPLKPCGINRRRWSRLRARAHRGLRRTAHQIVRPCAAAYRQWRSSNAQSSRKVEGRRAHAAYSKERKRFIRGYANFPAAVSKTLQIKHKKVSTRVKRPVSRRLVNLKARGFLHKRLRVALVELTEWERAQTTPTVVRRSTSLKAYDAVQVAQFTEVLGRIKNWARLYGTTSCGAQRFLKLLNRLPNLLGQDVLRHVRDGAANAVFNLTLLEKLLAEYRIGGGLSLGTVSTGSSVTQLDAADNQSSVNQHVERLSKEWLTGGGKRFLGFKRENLHRRDIHRGALSLPSPDGASAYLRTRRAEVAPRRTGRFLRTAAQLRSSFRSRLIAEQLCQNNVVAPFTFVLPTREKYISDDEKKRHEAAKRVRQLEHYRKTAHLSETFTNFVPQLLHMLKRLTAVPKTNSYNATRKLVTSLYWSLRFYMRRDYSGRRPDLRDLSVSQLRTLRQQVVTEAAHRYFDALDEDSTRWRFQKRRLAPRPDLSGGALRWLRTFFPSRHSLYLEDEDKYSPLYVTPSRVFRAHLSRSNPGTWRTDSLDDALEVRLKRLTGMRARRTTPRFEGMLATIKRTPTVVGQGAATRKRSTVGISQNLRTSFFSRSYSTTAYRNSPQRPTLIANQLTAVKRRTALLEDTLADTTAAVWHRSVKEGAYSRERKSYAPAPRELGAGALDPRLVRLKSLRNRQYLLRQGVSIPPLAALHNQRRLQARKVERALVDTERPTYFSSRWNRLQPVFSSSQQLPTIGHYRRNVRTRRAYTLVAVRALTSQKQQCLRRLSRCYGSVYRVRTRMLHSRRRTIRQLASTCGIVGPTPSTIMEQRSPLALRKTSGQHSLKTYERGFSVTHGALQLSKDVSYKSSLALRAQGIRVAKNIRKRRRLARWVVPALYQRSRPSKAMGKRQSPDYWTYEAVRPRLFSRPRKLAYARQVPARFYANTLGYCRRSSSRYLLSHRSRTNTARVGEYFASNTRQRRNRINLVSKGLAKRAQKLRENLFAWRRDEAWNEITLQWMKKARKLKNWLKFRKLKLKSKKIRWSILPEPVFKRMRSRLRKLEWREPDERFDRPGLWKAFSFHPSEKRRVQWLEWAMYRRALYSTRRHRYRRHQFPREQKRLKWLQFMRKTIYAPRADKAYIKGRRWPKARIYNNRLFRSLFNLRNDRAAMRHFQKLARRRPRVNGFSHSLSGLADRLDVNLMLLNLAPTVFWARLIATLGVFKVNGKVIQQAAYRLRAGDRVEWDLMKLEHIRANFQPYHTKSEYAKFRIKNSSAGVPANFLYFPQIHTAIYKGLPTMEDIRKNSRLHPVMFKLFRADVSATY